MEITPLDHYIQRGKPYEDNLCLFHCLALHNDCHTKNLERDTKHHYQQYREAGLSKKKFHGVKLCELDKLEKLYDINIVCMQIVLKGQSSCGHKFRTVSNSCSFSSRNCTVLIKNKSC